MNEPIFGAEFILPEHLQEQLDDISVRISKVVLETFELLYLDHDIPDNGVQEVVKLLVPKLKESIVKAVDQTMEELG